MRPDTDITYIRMDKGFVYLVAIMGWYSRYVISWELSTGSKEEFCVDALKKALNLAHLEILNFDQGSQLMSDEFIAALLDPRFDMKIGMDSKGRVFDNIFVERLRRTVKMSIRRTMRRYFNERIYRALDYKTPYEIYFKGRERTTDGLTWLFTIYKLIYRFDNGEYFNRQI